MKEDEKWIKAFKDKLEDYSEPMPASGWERLERELMPVTEKRIYPYRRWAVAAAAVVLVLTTAVSLYFLNSPVADEIRYATAPSLAVNPDVLPEPALPDVQVAVSEPVKPVGTTSINPVSGYLAKNTDPVIVPEVSSLVEKRPEAVTEEKRSEPQQEAIAAIEKKESATAQPPKRRGDRPVKTSISCLSETLLLNVVVNGRWEWVSVMEVDFRQMVPKILRPVR